MKSENEQTICLTLRKEDGEVIAVETRQLKEALAENPELVCLAALNLAKRAFAVTAFDSPFLKEINLKSQEMELSSRTSS
jgi:hypothetical protein